MSGGRRTALTVAEVVTLGLNNERAIIPFLMGIDDHTREE
jgi:hypothetical protein